METGTKRTQCHKTFEKDLHFTYGAHGTKAERQTDKVKTRELHVSFIRYRHDFISRQRSYYYFFLQSKNEFWVLSINHL